MLEFLKKYIISSSNLESNIKEIEEKIKLSKQKTDVLRELTEKYTESQQQLRNKQEFISKVISVIPSILYVYNIKENRNEWTNKQILNIMGYTKQEIKEMDSNVLKILMEEEDYSRYLIDVYPKYKSMTDDDILENEYKFICKNGGCKCFNIKEIVFSRDNEGNVKEILGNMIDITKLNRAYQEIKLNNKILDNATDSIIITDKKGDIIYINNSFCKRSGYEKDEVIGKNPRFLKSGQHDENFYTEMWNNISSGKPWNGIIINKHKNGSYFSETTTITPVANGEINYYIAIKVLNN